MEYFYVLLKSLASIQTRSSEEDPQNNALFAVVTPFSKWNPIALKGYTTALSH